MGKLPIGFYKARKIYQENGFGVLFKQVAHTVKKKIGNNPVELKKAIPRFCDDIDENLLLLDIAGFLDNGLLRPTEKVIRALRSIAPNLKALLASEARNTLAHEFKIYGHLSCRLDPTRFSWLRDPVTEYTWPMNPDIRFSEKPVGTDIKNTWELSRFYFLFQLSVSYAITQDESYAQFAIDRITAWIAENPFPHGPNWSRAMEASIRLLNWLVYIPPMKKARAFTDHFLAKLSNSIIEHYFFIRNCLEYSPYHANNHYLADLAALLSCKLLFPSFEWAQEYADYAAGAFCREILRQFNDSGINFEGSLSYHRLGTEILIVGISIYQRAGYSIPSDIIRRLQTIRFFTTYYTETAEEPPIIGDNDSGIFVKFFPGQAANAPRYLRFLFSLICSEKVSPRNWDETLCAIQFEPIPVMHMPINNLSVVKTSNKLQARNFNGLIIAKHGNDSVFFNTMNAFSGHIHNDKLSVYPVIDGNLVFVDRGSFSYTGFLDKRNEDRKSTSHNAPVVNDWEQNQLWKQDVFFVDRNAECAHRLEQTDGSLFITGWHRGYARYKRPLKVFREIIWDTANCLFIICDWITGGKPADLHEFSWNFLIHPFWSIQTKNTSISLKSNSRTICFSSEGPMEMSVASGSYCPFYQMELVCPALQIKRILKNDQKHRFTLRYHR
jgi:hypothetical protein